MGEAVGASLGPSLVSPGVTPLEQALPPPRSIILFTQCLPWFQPQIKAPLTLLRQSQAEESSLCGELAIYNKSTSQATNLTLLGAH